MKNLLWTLLLAAIIFSTLGCESEADIAPTNFRSPPISYPGDVIGANISLEVINIGIGKAFSRSGYFFVGFYISRDTGLDSSDILLEGGHESVGTPIEVGEIKKVAVSNVMSVPTSIQPGQYYLIAVIDEEGNRVEEIDEGNNISVNPITIALN